MAQHEEKTRSPQASRNYRLIGLVIAILLVPAGVRLVRLVARGEAGSLAVGLLLTLGVVVAAFLLVFVWIAFGDKRAGVGPGRPVYRAILGNEPQRVIYLKISEGTVSLARRSGKTIAEWPGNQLAVTRDRLYPGPSAVAHRGLVLNTPDGTYSILFPSRSTFSYPQQTLDSVVNDLSRAGVDVSP